MNDSSNATVDGEAISESNDDEECFVIAPIGDPRTETRRQTDGLLNEAIRPVVEEDLGLHVTAAHQLPEAGSITRQVIQRLLEAELVVADLTDLNANVMYELAVRHAKGEPVVPIAEKGTSLPFDITTERTIFYEESFHGLNELKPKLKDAACAALEDEEPDNPIYRAQQDFQMREAVSVDSEMDYVMKRLDTIESGIEHANFASQDALEPFYSEQSFLYEVRGEERSKQVFLADLGVVPENQDPNTRLVYQPHGESSDLILLHMAPGHDKASRGMVESMAAGFDDVEIIRSEQIS
jgi:hypothetical protein